MERIVGSIFFVKHRMATLGCVRFFVCMMFCHVLASGASAQNVVDINDAFDQHIFTYGEIEYLEDPTGAWTIDDVKSHHFISSKTYKPESNNTHSVYWYRIRTHQLAETSKSWVLEFFDQTIDHIDLYMPTTNGKFTRYTLGDEYKFDQRSLKHKNLVFRMPNQAGDNTYYFKVRSAQKADIIVVLRSMSWLFQYATDEYFSFGIFYGMILVFSFYNLLMYAAIRETHYLYYILYLVSIGLYEMSADGIAFQYLWPNAPGWNQHAVGFLLFAASTCALLFVNSFLHLRTNYNTLYRLIQWVLIFRIAYLVLSLTLFPTLFLYRVVDVLPFAAGFYAALVTLVKGYRPARFVVVGYGFLFFGIISWLILYLDIDWKPFGELSHYSMGFCFIMEMVFLSFAISDKVRILRKEKETAQNDMILQLQENHLLQENHNKKLEEQVSAKTRDLLTQAQRIEHQNDLLKEANARLEQQASEIARMNLILSEDNLHLKENVVRVTEARILSKSVDFEEFSLQYPDDDSCLKFLADLKWRSGYSCYRCNHGSYSPGRSAHGRRCTKCGYEESATANTILQSTHLPINKAFYMIFLVYTSKGNISSYKLSEILKIRQSTCWSYSAKIKKVLREKKKNGMLDASAGWNDLLIAEESLVKVKNEK